MFNLIFLFLEQSQIADDILNKFNEAKKDAMEKAGEDQKEQPETIPEYDSSKPIGEFIWSNLIIGGLSVQTIYGGLQA